mmetsp:Transcript_82878/g.208831  ORF Transcript_82878/g.208831 Transcript_82878/m.208831 type:complete len:308 (-) Transcript_82878:1520-2443(-)
MACELPQEGDACAHAGSCVLHIRERLQRIRSERTLSPSRPLLGRPLRPEECRQRPWRSCRRGGTAAPTALDTGSRGGGGGGSSHAGSGCGGEVLNVAHAMHWPTPHARMGLEAQRPPPWAPCPHLAVHEALDRALREGANREVGVHSQGLRDRGAVQHQEVRVRLCASTSEDATLMTHNTMFCVVAHLASPKGMHRDDILRGLRQGRHRWVPQIHRIGDKRALVHLREEPHLFVQHLHGWRVGSTREVHDNPVQRLVKLKSAPVTITADIVMAHAQDTCTETHCSVVAVGSQHLVIEDPLEAMPILD